MIRLTTAFSVVVEDFDDELSSLIQLVDIGQDRSASKQVRVATIHATTLLLAAAFEEFVREMARVYAMEVVSNASDVSEVPDALLETAWKRTFGELARSKGNGRSKREALEGHAKRARPKIDALCAFIEGDTTQDIFADLIHNDNNMRGGEVNRLFKVGGLPNVCLQICAQGSLREFFDRNEEGEAHGDLLAALEEFFNRRNEIAHSLNSARSSAPDEVVRYIDMFRAFSKDLGATLEAEVSAADLPY